MDHPFPRDGLLEKELEDATSMSNVELRDDGRGNVWLIVKRDELDFFLARCAEIDRFLNRAEELGGCIPEGLGR